MLKREWIVESNRKLPHLFIPIKITTLVIEFAIEDLLLGRTAALVPEFAVWDLSLGRTLIMMMMMIWMLISEYYFVQLFQWILTLLGIIFNIHKKILHSTSLYSLQISLLRLSLPQRLFVWYLTTVASRLWSFPSQQLCIMQHMNIDLASEPTMQHKNIDLNRAYFLVVRYLRWVMIFW